MSAPASSPVEKFKCQCSAVTSNYILLNTYIELHWKTSLVVSFRKCCLLLSFMGTSALKDVVIGGVLLRAYMLRALGPVRGTDV